MNQALVLDDVPTEVVPGISPAIALVHPLVAVECFPPDANRCRPIIQDVNALPAFTAPRDVLDVLSISCPHFTEPIDQCHRKPLVTLGSTNIRGPMILIVRGHINGEAQL